MEFEWDEGKRKLNAEKHGLDFEDAALVFEGPLWVLEDKRCDYGEPRYIAVGELAGRVVVVAYTKRRGDIVRVISMRKANQREQARYKKRLEQT